MQSNGGLIDVASGRRRTPPGPCCPARPAARPAPPSSRAAAGASDALCFDMGGTSCDVCVVDDGAVRGDARAARSPAGRSRCRCSTSTRSAPAAARSPGATPAARCGSGRARRAPIPGRPATAAAATSRRSPTPTCCSATCRPTRRWPAASSSTATRPRRRSAGSPTSSASTPRPAPRGSCRVANAEMVRALRVVTVERGIDPRALRAAGLRRRRRRCTPRAIADELGIDTDPLPARVGVLAALGPGRLPRAARDVAAQRAARAATTLTAEAIAGDVAELGERGARRARRAGRPSCARPTSCATAGQAFELADRRREPSPTPEELREAFERRARGALRLRATRSRSSSS